MTLLKTLAVWVELDISLGTFLLRFMLEESFKNVLQTLQIRWNISTCQKGTFLEHILMTKKISQLSNRYQRLFFDDFKCYLGGEKYPHWAILIIIRSHLLHAFDFTTCTFPSRDSPFICSPPGSAYHLALFPHLLSLISAVFLFIPEAYLCSNRTTPCCRFPEWRPLEP